MRLVLTKRTGGAIRILLHLASLPSGSQRTSTQLADASGVTQGNVATLVAALSRAHLLDCTRGPGGGCSLARDPSEITIAEVVTAIEGSLEPQRCAIDERRCVDRDFPCGLHQTWTAVVRSVADQLTDLSLAQALEDDVAFSS